MYNKYVVFMCRFLKLEKILIYTSGISNLNFEDLKKNTFRL